MNMKKNFLIFFVLTILLFLAVPALADNVSLPVQGYMVDLNSNLPLTGTHDVAFNLYEDCDDVDPFLIDAQILNFEEGIYSSFISLNPNDLAVMAAGSDFCLGIQIDDDVELAPRVESFTTPYAIMATQAQTAQVALSLDSDYLETLTTSDITAITAGTGLTGGGASGDVTLSADVGTTANKLIQLDGSARLPAVNASQLTGLNASNVTSGTLPDARLSPNVSFLGLSIDLTSEVTGILPLGNLPADTSFLGSSIDSSEITDGTVVLDDLAVDSVDSSKILDGGVGQNDLASDSVDSSKILDTSISTDDLADDLVTLAKLATAARTRIETSFIENPVNGDDGQVQFKFPYDIRIQKFSCSTEAGTVTLQLDKRSESTPNTAGTDILSSAIVCDTSTESTTSFSVTSIAAYDVINFDVDGATGSPDSVRLHLEYLIE